MSHIKEILKNKQIQLEFEKELMIRAIKQTTEQVVPGTTAKYDEINKKFIYHPQINEEQRKIIKKLWIKNYKKIKKAFLGQDLAESEE